MRGEPAERFQLVIEGWEKVFRDNRDGGGLASQTDCGSTLGPVSTGQ